jgi:arsenate reductase
MAEGWAKELRGEVIGAHSAGIKKHGLNSRAVKVMAEAGVDISSYESKTVAELETKEFDYIITLCDDARQTCPVFSGEGKVIHRGFDDPPRLAEGAKDEQEALGHYRRVRDEIRKFIEQMPENL